MHKTDPILPLVCASWLKHWDAPVGWGGGLRTFGEDLKTYMGCLHGLSKGRDDMS